MGDPAKRREYDCGGFGNVPPRSASAAYREAASAEDFFNSVNRKYGMPATGAEKFYQDSKYGSGRRSSSNKYGDDNSDSDSWDPPSTRRPRTPPDSTKRPTAVLEHRDGVVVAVVKYESVKRCDKYELWMKTTVAGASTGDEEWTRCYSGSKLKVVVNGLIEGCMYDFYVICVNKYGASPMSSTVGVLYPKSTPQPPPASPPPAASPTERQSSEHEQEKKLRVLVEMGFSEVAARHALELHGWNETGALNYLLGADPKDSVEAKTAKKKKKKKKKNTQPPLQEQPPSQPSQGSSVAPASSPQPPEEIQVPEVPPEPDPSMPIKCSRCKEFVPYAKVGEHECDPNMVHLRNFSSIVHCEDLFRLQALLKRAHGELHTAIDLYYQQESEK